MFKNVIDPKSVGLGPRDAVIQIDTDHYAFFIDRKSRIVMADAKRIIEKVQILSRCFPEARISVKTTAPVCSKTNAVLKSRHIDVI